MTLILFWTLATFIIGSSSILIGKRYGVVYPIAVFASLATIANILAAKLVLIGPYIVPGGIIVFMTTYLITDLISEIWGKKKAQEAVWSGFLVSIFAVIAIQIVILWPSPEFGIEFSDKFTEVLGGTWRIIGASMVAYLVAMHLDVIFFHKIKEFTAGRHLWLRNNTASIAANTVGATIFIVLAFWGQTPNLIALILTVVVVEAVMVMIDTPIAYFVRWAARKITPVST